MSARSSASSAGVSDYAALALLITSKGAFFIADTQVRTPNPSAEELAEIASLAAVHVQRFNIKPKIAFVSHSDFGSYDTIPRARCAAQPSC